MLAVFHRAKLNVFLSRPEIQCPAIRVNQIEVMENVIRSGKAESDNKKTEWVQSLSMAKYL